MTRLATGVADATRLTKESAMLQIRRNTLAAVAVLASQAEAQSDPSNFDAVINIPGIAGSVVSAATPIGAVGSSLQLNLMPGGVVQPGAFTQAGANVEINVLGGFVGPNFTVNAGATLNVVSGLVEDGLRIDGGTVNQSGGEVDRLELGATATFRSSGGTAVVDAIELGQFRTVHVGGGDVTLEADFLRNTHITMTAGRLSGDVDLRNTSSFVASGGQVLSVFELLPSTFVRFVADAFFLDGADITERVATVDDAAIGLETHLPRRDDAVLVGHFADGNVFDLLLGSNGLQGPDRIDPNATVSIVRNTDAASCSPADIAEPFGVLDIADVVGFLQTFEVGCP